MLTAVILPQLGDTMDQGTITRWFKQPGDMVKKGQALFEVLTDKANIEVEATASGYLRQQLYGENAVVPSGEIIAYLTTAADEPLNVDAPIPATTETLAPDSVPVLENASVAPSSAPPRRKQFVSPRARRIAQAYGIDVTLLIPASKSGRIMEADVRRALDQRAPSAGPVPAPVLQPHAVPSNTSGADTVIPITGIRQVIFERMASSAREVARVTLNTEADATALVELREAINSRQTEMRFSFTDLFVLLVARSLTKFPYMNATLQSDGIHQHSYVNLGIATDTPRGLLVPVLHDAHQKGLGEINTELRRLGNAARDSKILPADLRGGTFTITNLGQQEIDAFTPIINQPEIAILGIGRIAQKPAAHQGQLALRWMVALSLSFDHRVVDGAPAGRFLQGVKQLVETPGLVLI